MLEKCSSEKGRGANVFLLGALVIVWGLGRGVSSVFAVIFRWEGMDCRGYLSERQKARKNHLLCELGKGGGTKREMYKTKRREKTSNLTEIPNLARSARDSCYLSEQKTIHRILGTRRENSGLQR